MLKANQNALVQGTNIALLGIRNAELNYYQSFYIFFGGQAAIIGGFAYGSLTQISFTEPHDIDDYFYIQLLFWLRFDWDIKCYLLLLCFSKFIL